MSVSEGAGWLVIVLVMYASAAAIVRAGCILAHARRPTMRVSKPIVRLCTIALAVAIWYAIPVLVHARFGRAPH